MNRAELSSYEPTGQGWPWTVAELVRPVRMLSADLRYVPAFRVRRNAPVLRASYAKRLWQTICEAQEPLAKGAWLDRAKVFGKKQRTLGHSAIFNLLKGNWVREDDGFFRRQTR